MWIDDGAGGQQGGTPKPHGFFTDMTQQLDQQGSWSYDEPTLRQIAKEWQNLADDCLTAVDHSIPMTQVVGPGADPASAYMAGKANASGQTYQDMVREMQVYAQAQADACTKALGTYQEREAEHKSVFSDIFGVGPTGQQGGII